MNKICYFINSDWYFDLHWLERALSAQKNGFEVHLITRFSGEQYRQKFSELGLICHTLPLKERSYSISGFITGSVKAFLLLKKIAPSLIHSVTIKPILIGGCFARLSATPFVANIVGLGRVFRQGGLLKRLLNKIVCTLYSFIFANKRSRVIFEHAADLHVFTQKVFLRSCRATVIDGCGVDIEQYSYSKETASARPVVLFASRMLRDKGLATLIAIRQQLAAEGVFFTLQVAGIMVDDDPDAICSEEIEAWAAAGDIEWLGTCRDMDSLLSSVNIIALPTLYPEGVPRILLEGAAKGRACIAYDSGGCHSIVADNVNGFLIRRGDVEHFRHQLKILLLDADLRERMGKNGRQRVTEKFSANKVIACTMAIYQQVLEKGR